MAPEIHSRSATSGVRKVPLKALPPASYDNVLKRNLFHVSLEPATGRSRANGAAGPLSPEEEARLQEEMGRLPVSKLGWTLLGTIVNSFAPAQSRAIMVVDGKQGAFGTNSELKGWRIAYIERRTVVLEKNGRRERLLVGGAEIGAPPPAAPAPRRNLSANEISRALSDLPGLMRDARFAAAEVNGVNGLALSFVQPDSFLARLGLRQNDLLTSANGNAISTLRDLAGFANLASQDSLRLELLRDGQPIVIEYDISR